MRVCDCEHPKLIYNKYTRKRVFVSCGKCVSCRRKQTSIWIARMQQEAKCHAFTFMLYLDYNDEHLPLYDYVDRQLVERNPRFYKIKNYKYPLCYGVDSFKFDTFSDLSYFVRRGRSIGLPHGSVYDLQTFKKRLNTYICREVTGSYGSFRSCIATEYGPSTFRPHYHGILFFDDERLARTATDEKGNIIYRTTTKGEVYASTVINELVHKAWSDVSGCPFGHSTCRPDHGQGKSLSYTAKYIKLPTDLPSFYNNPPFLSNFLTSRNPPIGSLLQSTTEIHEIFFNASCQRVVFGIEQGLTKVNVVPIGESYKNKLFPKCPLYGEVSDYERVELYKSVISTRGLFDSFGDFLGSVYSRCCSGYFNFHDYDGDLLNIHLPDGKLNFYDTQFCRNIRRMTQDFSCLNSLLTLFRVGSRIWYQSQIFGVSFDFYLQQIFTFYKKYDLYKLRMFYLSQEEYFQKYPLSDLPYWYPLTFMDLGYDPSRTKQCMEHCEDSRLKNEKESKTQKKNMYFESLELSTNKEKKQLYLLIKSYYNGKKCNETLEAFAKSWQE